MSNRLVFDGLDQLFRDLQRLPGALRDEATTVIHDTATGAVEEMRAAYPEGPRGRLKRGLKVALRQEGDFGAAGVVTNTAPHAFIFEQGTQARYVSTLPLGRAKNFGYRRGAMPPGRVFIPIAIRRRRAMYGALAEVVRREGFEVSGRAG
jgi:hypothetical protein